MFKSRTKFLTIMACLSFLLACGTFVFCLDRQQLDGSVNIQYTAPKELLKYEKNAAGTEYKVVGYNDGYPTTVLEIPDTRADENGNNLPVTEIGERAFYQSKKFTSLKIGKNVKTIGERAFYECNTIEGTLKLPDGLTSIGPYAFCNCRKLSGTLNIPTGITSISDHAFYSCQFSGNFVVPNQVTSIGNSAFYSNDFTSVTIHDNVTFLGHCAFAHCVSLTTVNYNAKNCETDADPSSGGAGVFGDLYSDGAVFNIGNNVQNFKLYEMLYRSNISQLNVGSSIKSFGNTTFGIVDNCLSKIYVDKGNSTFTSRDKTETKECNVLVDKTSKTLLLGSSNGGDMSNLNITTIGGYAFYSCTSLTSIKFPSTLQRIEDSAFDGCVYVSGDVVIPDSVEYIGYDAFDGLGHNVNLNYSATDSGFAYLGNSNNPYMIMFKYTSSSNLNSITIPEQCKFILSDGSFYFKFKTITIPANLRGISGNFFSYCKFDTITLNSSYIYREITSYTLSCGRLINALQTGGTLKVLTSCIGGYNNTYLNNTSYFTKSTSGSYTIYTKK